MRYRRLNLFNGGGGGSVIEAPLDETGTIRSLLSDTIPDGYLLCDGTTFSKNSHPTLQNLYTYLHALPCIHNATPNSASFDGPVDSNNWFAISTGTYPFTDKWVQVIGVYNDSQPYIYVGQTGYLYAATQGGGYDYYTFIPDDYSTGYPYLGWDGYNRSCGAVTFRWSTKDTANNDWDNGVSLELPDLRGKVLMISDAAPIGPAAGQIPYKNGNYIGQNYFKIKGTAYVGDHVHYAHEHIGTNVQVSCYADIGDLTVDATSPGGGTSTSSATGDNTITSNVMTSTVVNWIIKT